MYPPPRSILKSTGRTASSSSTQSATPYIRDSHTPPPAVRFPSSPKLSTVHYTHCSSSYDRSPIIVAPNTCALPERGECTTYEDASGARHGASSYSVAHQALWGKHLHPSMMGTPVSKSAPASHSEATCVDLDQTSYHYGLFPPPLSCDEGSSEESDGIASPPPETVAPLSDSKKMTPSQSFLHSSPNSHPPISCSNQALRAQSGTALNLHDLHQQHQHHLATHDNTHSQYQQHQYSMLPSIAGSEGPDQYSLSFLPHAPSNHSKRVHREKKKTTHRQPSTSTFSCSWGETDESSCLGGF